MRARTFVIASAIAFLSASLMAGGQQPDIVNGKLDQASAAAGLQAAIAVVTRADAGPAWIGYAVPAVADGQRNGRADHGWGSCSAHLDGYESQTTGSGARTGPSQRSIQIFLRIQQQRIDKIRMFESNCRVDAGGNTVYWLTDVRPVESVELLRPYAQDGPHGDKGAALAAIASTDDPSADTVLAQFTSTSSPADLRKETAFWLGAARGQRGYEMLRTLVKSDPSDEVRDRAIFALSITPAPEAVDTLIDEARHDTNPHLRGQAMFWLAQKAGEKAVAVINSAVENDPDTEVKKKAVFALSQLPPDRGVPLLIKTAETNRNPEVRKQAFFWLGQSKDPRALDFIARVILN